MGTEFQIALILSIILPKSRGGSLPGFPGILAQGVYLCGVDVGQLMDS